MRDLHKNQLLLLSTTKLIFVNNYIYLKYCHTLNIIIQNLIIFYCVMKGTVPKLFTF